MAIRQAVILVGGLGTRVREITQDRLPKPLLDINGEPFLALQLRWLKQQGIEKVTLASGHLSDVIRARLGTDFENMALRYSDEGEVRMGTGGALRLALANGSVDAQQPFFALNGDTWFPVDLAALTALHQQRQAQITLALRHVADLQRYGTVAFASDGRIRQFGEKAGHGAGWINGGVYVIEAAYLAGFEVAPFSLENGVLARHCQAASFYAMTSTAAFCDIGTPADYHRFCQERKP